jgi:hypothetical protein
MVDSGRVGLLLNGHAVGSILQVKLWVEIVLVVPSCIPEFSKADYAIRLRREESHADKAVTNLTTQVMIQILAELIDRTGVGG